MKIISRFVVSGWILIVILTMGCVERQKTPLVSKGFIDLTEWNFQENGPVNLNGEWAFYWNQFIDPESLNICSEEEQKDFFYIPKLWNGKTANGIVLSPKGYATYRLKIKVKPSSVLNSLLITDVLSVCKVWVNGVPVDSNGVPGISRATEKPHHHLMVSHILSSADCIDITLQVSNYHNVQGGINVPVFWGPQDQIQKKLNKKWVSTAFLGGAFLLMGIFHIVLFLMRKSERANLYFGLYCFTWCMSTVFGVTGSFLMEAIFPFLTWRLSIDITLISFGFTIPLLIMFYHALFPTKCAKTVDRFYMVLGGLYIAFIIVTPPNAYDRIALLYCAVTRTAYIYLFGSFMIDLARKEEGVQFLILGYAVLFISEINKVLINMHLINSIELISSPYCEFIFIISYSLFISLRFSQAFSTVERLSHELERTNTRLLNLNMLKDEFLANTSHELKTPLAGIIGISETLISGAGGKLSPIASANLKMIIASGKRLSNLVNDVLDFSRLKHKDIVLQLKPVNLFHAAETVLAVSRELGRGRNLELKNEIPLDISSVYADEERLEQIFFNLVGNAVKFTEKGTVTISAVERKDVVEISVTDTGAGIPKESCLTIFESFEQLHSVDTGSTGGTGLGLSITRKLLELHNGKIEVESEVGKGSVFRFFLPRSPEKTDAENHQIGDTETGNEDAAFEVYQQLFPVPFPYQQDFKKQPELYSEKSFDPLYRKYHVLVVDDEPVNLHMITSHLLLAGIQVKTAGSGKDALLAIEQGEIPGVILLDIMMPWMNGYEVCRQLRKKYPESAIPVIMLTAKNRLTDLIEGFGAGANDYLTKPFAKDELLARVKTQLKLKQAYDLLKENLSLKKELAMRQQTEQELKLMQRKLSEMLNSIDDAIFAVNQSREISFCNQSFESLTGYSAANLLGQPLHTIFKDDQDNINKQILFNDLFDSPSAPVKNFSYPNFTIKKADGADLNGTAFITAVELDEDILYLMVLRQPQEEGTIPVPSTPALLLVNELNRNRQRLLSIEEALLSLQTGAQEKSKPVFDDLKAIDTLFERLSGHIEMKKDIELDKKRSLAVRVMNLSVDLWKVITKTTKADFAEQSRIWSVYVEKDGYIRTQTLDKYLSKETLPKNPRWKQVYATADFVLAACEHQLPLKKELETALCKLKDCF